MGSRCFAAKSPAIAFLLLGQDMAKSWSSRANCLTQLQKAQMPLLLLQHCNNPSRQAARCHAKRQLAVLLLMPSMESWGSQLSERCCLWEESPRGCRRIQSSVPENVLHRRRIKPDQCRWIGSATPFYGLGRAKPCLLPRSAQKRLKWSCCF